MPITGDALLGSGSGLVGGTINAISTGVQNKKNRQFATEMYNRQKADNYEFWQIQNEYNSPASQMARFKDAGLNPHLIYGQSNNAGPISTPDYQAPQSRAPEWGQGLQVGGLAYMNAIYDLDIKQAQAENLRAQKNVIDQEAILKGIQSGIGEFDLGFKNDMRETSGDMMRERLRQLRTSTDLSINEDVRRAVAQSSSLREASERMLNMVEQRANMQASRLHTWADTQRVYADRDRVREAINLMQKDGTLKQLEIELKSKGITWQDPLWQRAAALVLSKAVQDNPDNPVRLLQKLPSGSNFRHRPNE